MKNNRSGHISEKELDSLLNKAFLNLDFESNSKNKEVLAVVTKQVMRSNSFFNTRNLNLLFLLLSLLAFLTSFYRYVDPLLIHEPKRGNNTPGIKATEQKKAVLSRSSVSYSIKNSGKNSPGKIISSDKIENIRSAKKKVRSNIKKNDAEIIPAALIKTNLMDSVSKISIADSIVKNTDGINDKTLVGPPNIASEKKSPAKSTMARSRDTKASKKLDALKPATKVKVGKRRKVKFFDRASKVRKRGSRFLKDSGRR